MKTMPLFEEYSNMSLADAKQLLLDSLADAEMHEISKMNGIDHIATTESDDKYNEIFIFRVGQWTLGAWMETNRDGDVIDHDVTTPNDIDVYEKRKIIKWEWEVRK